MSSNWNIYLYTTDLVLEVLADLKTANSRGLGAKAARASSPLSATCLCRAEGWELSVRLVPFCSFSDPELNGQQPIIGYGAKFGLTRT